MGAGTSSAGAFAEAVRALREALAAAGRDPSAFPTGKRAYVAIDQPRERVETWYRAVYGRPAPDGDVLFTGDAEAVAERLAGLVEAGAQHLLVHPIGDERAQLDVVAARVLPLLRAR